MVPRDTFPDKSGLCSLLLATWAGYLNLTKACAIFSVSMIPQACPSHSLQFVRFRHIILVWEISPPTTHTHTHTLQKHREAAACLSVLFRISCKTFRLAQACPGLLKKRAVLWHLSCSKQSTAAVTHTLVTIAVMHCNTLLPQWGHFDCTYNQKYGQCN